MVGRGARRLRQHAPWFVALFFALGGGSYALASGSSSGGSKRIYACVTQDYGTLNLSNATRRCPTGQRKISWSADGTAGPRGLRGATGPKGAAGATGPTGAPGATGAKGATGATGGVGPAGATGAAGAIGPAGPAGSTGAKGDTGETGPRGDTGATGPIGPIGPQGDTGPQGAPGANGRDGASAPADYAHVYNQGAEVVPVEADITFDSTGVAAGVSHAPGNAGIVVDSAGVYEVRFEVNGVEPNQFALFDNGAPLAGATFGSSAGTDTTVGDTMVQLDAGDVLTLRNHSSSTAVTLQTLAGGTQINVNASLTVQRLPDSP